MRRFLSLTFACLIGMLTLLCTSAQAQSWIDWRSKDNLATVGASAVEQEFVLDALSQPGGLFYPDEAAEATLVVPDSPQEPIDGAVLELVNVHNRHAAPGEVGFVLVTVAPKVLKGDSPPARVELDKFNPDGKRLKVTLPLPREYGTQMILLERRGGKRTFIGSVARVHKPVDRKGRMPQIMAESGVSSWSRLDNAPGAELLAATYERMGIKFVRWEFHWSQNGPDQPYNWSFMDVGIPALARHQIKMMNTMGAQPGWSMPMEGGPIPSALHTENHVSARKFDGDFAKWVRAFVGRFWTGGESGLWAIEHYNEPWEPVSCAGWQSDSCRYRELLEILSREAHSVAPDIKIAAACSIMNTEDKLTSDGSADRMQWIDLLTDHYVTPACAYGPRVAAKYGKVSGETETWGACSEVLLPQFLTQFLAVGNRWVNPMTGDMPLEELGSKDHPLLTPKPLVAAVSAWNAIVADRPFERIAFTTHLPWLYQFGPDDDARFVLYGKAMPLASGNVRDLVWRQAADGPNGEITIADPDGALVVVDMEGNPVPRAADKSVRLPMTPTAYYLQSARGAAYVIDCVRKGRLEGLRQVEIVPGTLTSIPSAAKPAELPIRIHNLRSAAVDGELKVSSLLKNVAISFSAKVALAAGDSATVKLPLTKLPEGGMPLKFEFVTPAGTDTWQEVVRSTAIPKVTLAIDGDAAAWAKLPVTMVIRPEGNDTGNPIERAWLPFLEKRPGSVPAKHGELRMAWDDNNLYLQASIESDPLKPRDRFDGWDQDQYFYSAKTDETCEKLRPFEQLVRSKPGNQNDREGWERFVKQPGYDDFMKHLAGHPDEFEVFDLHAASTYFDRKNRNPKATFADASFVYKRDISQQHPFAGDGFQFAFDVDPAYQWAASTHDLKYPQGTLPAGYQCTPDTDYEFALYGCTDGKSELMCLLSPEMPRVHVYPRQPRGKLYPHSEQARSTVTFENGRAMYRAALPWKAVGIDKPAAGANFGFTFAFNGIKGDRTSFGEDMASTKSNSLTMHPYWSAKPSNTVRWTLQP